MTPYQFNDTYHSLPVSDPRTKLDVNLDLKKYRSGWFPEDQVEATKVLDAVAKKCCGLRRGNAELPAVFSIGKDDRADPKEEFYCAGVRRAFGSRGSPAEVQDALRLAVLGGVTTPTKAKDYAEKWFGQDCNAFVANYHGLSPMISIAAYAKGYGPGPIAKAGPDIYDCRDLLPLPVREDPETVAEGDVIVTYGSLHPTHKWRWRHIAVVESITVSDRRRKEGDADIWEADLRLAEWGTTGGRAKHQNRYAGKLMVDALKWKPPAAGDWYAMHGSLKKEMAGKKLVGFPGTDPDGKEAIRFFLDASSLNFIWHRGLHIRNRFDGH